MYGQGSYSASVALRAKEFAEEMTDAVGASLVSALPLFLVGFWFVRSGVVTRLHDHLPFFRRLLSWSVTRTCCCPTWAR